ncbi:Sensor_kinase_SpoOB-type, alpha-helical domain [Fontibacillus panacisegetis]|uniref:Sensor_kinase_SpoOB-type, alpha-helical domain n=1 Tax=Fontibacillus panacisegetis TaxID=670482 RepID=A0A1G7JKB2_9BACL|nr:Spo0B domain-containing protein [Fontibacillus panacisegetis]SDF25333.1 Sensor_kinase_SpoOB-type, alpha-helical domain [Fontibacillus panacisegetis]
MKYRFTVPAIVVILSIACLSANYFISSLVGYVGISCCLLILCWWYIRYIHRQAVNERKILLESVQRTATATLGHHRHDWMNDLQILYGYIQLGKYDKLADCVERIKERMAVEGKIARLGIPSLVFYLQSFREMNGSIQLEIYVQENLHLDDLLLTEDGEEFSLAITETIRAYQFCGRSSWGEIVRLKLSFCLEGNEVAAIFEQEGSGSVDTLTQLLENWDKEKRVVAERLDSEISSLRLRIACGN